MAVLTYINWGGEYVGDPTYTYNTTTPELPDNWTSDARGVIESGGAPWPGNVFDVSASSNDGLQETSWSSSHASTTSGRFLVECEPWTQDNTRLVYLYNTANS